MSTTRKMTKDQLITENERLRAHANQLETVVESQRIEITQLRQQYLAARKQADQANQRSKATTNTSGFVEYIKSSYTNAAGITMHKVCIGFNKFKHVAASEYKG